MSFSVFVKIHFLVDLSFVSLHFDKSNLCWVEEFLLCKDKLEQGSESFDHWKKKLQEIHSQTAGRLDHVYY